MTDAHGFNCETYFQASSQHVDDLFSYEKSESTMATVQMFTPQENRCKLRLDYLFTTLRNVVLSIQSNDDMVSADDVQRIVERALLAPQNSFSGNMDHGSKNTK